MNLVQYNDDLSTDHSEYSFSHYVYSSSLYISAHMDAHPDHHHEQEIFDSLNSLTRKEALGQKVQSNA
jgi:hypothetical protein